MHVTLSLDVVILLFGVFLICLPSYLSLMVVGSFHYCHHYRLYSSTVIFSVFILGVYIRQVAYPIWMEWYVTEVRRLFVLLSLLSVVGV